MPKFKHQMAIVFFALCALKVDFAYALNSVTVMADSSMQGAIAEIARDYSRDRQVIVNTSFAPQAEQEKQIDEGSAADILITPQQSWINRLKEHGLVDVYSQAQLASAEQPVPVHYFAVAIAGDNMDEARKFLEYLKSPGVQEVLRQNGFATD